MNSNNLIINIKKLRVRTYIGFNPDELVNKQDVLINITLETEIPKAAMDADEPLDILDYRTVTKMVVKLVQEGRFKLLEVLTAQILNLIMKDQRVKWARVEVDKPHVLRFAKSVSVEMEAKR
ncbi:MAG: dihydroneopterin triphosphate 2'-epimerase [Draconibacterium sp.]|nr:MAG: dihydroneopterin triphosphate 2'-epimerase [Draconibacterium sp.]